jgi:hypothetical protein
VLKTPALVINTPKTTATASKKLDHTDQIISSLPAITIDKQDNLDQLEEKLQKIIKNNKK